MKYFQTFRSDSFKIHGKLVAHSSDLVANQTRIRGATGQTQVCSSTIFAGCVRLRRGKAAAAQGGGEGGRLSDSMGLDTSGWCFIRTGFGANAMNVERTERV